MAWLEDQWNNPGLTEQYLMQIAAEIRKVLAKKPNAILLEHFKLKFVRRKAKGESQVSERAAKHSWSSWLGILGMSKKKEELEDVEFVPVSQWEENHDGG